MNIQESKAQQFHVELGSGQSGSGPNVSNRNKEQRRFKRYKIKRRVLIKNPDGKILTGNAFDISRQGLQFRCPPRTAYLLETIRSSRQKYNEVVCEIKIALPYMSELSECIIHCAIQEIEKANEEHMRVGFNFLSLDQKSQMRLRHFIENLTY